MAADASSSEGWEGCVGNISDFSENFDDFSSSGSEYHPPAPENNGARGKSYFFLVKIANVCLVLWEIF